MTSSFLFASCFGGPFHKHRSSVASQALSIKKILMVLSMGGKSCQWAVVGFEP